MTKKIKMIKIKNTGKNPAYVYLKVMIPKKEVITAEENGKKKNDGSKVLTDLFTYDINSPDWTEIKSNDEESKETTNYTTHVYYYKNALKPGEVTSALFEKVKLVNIIEDQLVNDDASLDIKIDAFAIQSDNLPDETSIADAYKIYLNQNSVAKE